MGKKWNQPLTPQYRVSRDSYLEGRVRYCAKCRKELIADSGEPLFWTYDTKRRGLLVCARCFWKSAQKGKGKPTLRQVKAVNLMLQGFSPARALRLAGYTKSTRKNIGVWTNRVSVQALLKEKGLKLMKENPNEPFTPWEAAIRVGPERRTKPKEEPKKEEGFAAIFKRQEQERFKDWQDDYIKSEKRKLKKAPLTEVEDWFCPKCSRNMPPDEPMFRIAGSKRKNLAILICAPCYYEERDKHAGPWELPTPKQKRVAKILKTKQVSVSKALTLAGYKGRLGPYHWLRCRGAKEALKAEGIRLVKGKQFYKVEKVEKNDKNNDKNRK